MSKFSLGAFQLSHYNDVEYAMHLIGNAFSVPTVEQVLFRLKELYGPEEQQRCNELYANMQYRYKWEPLEPCDIVVKEEPLF